MEIAKTFIICYKEGPTKWEDSLLLPYYLTIIGENLIS